MDKYQQPFEEGGRASHATVESRVEPAGKKLKIL
jgi:hypothetical protein